MTYPIRELTVAERNEISLALRQRDLRLAVIAKRRIGRSNALLLEARGRVARLLDTLADVRVEVTP